MSSSHSRSHSPQDDPVNPTNTGESRSQVARLKRRLAASQNELAEVTKTKSKRPPTTVTLGRGVRRIVTLYDSLSSIVEEADRRVMELDTFEAEVEVVEVDKIIQRARDRAWSAYKILLYMTPQLRTVLEDPDPASLNIFVAQLQEGGNGARGDDIKRIKEELGTWINTTYKPSVPLNTKTREGRGLQHDVCGRLLVPIQYDWNDPIIRANVRNTVDGYSLANKYFLTCLYPTHQANPRRIEQNFLRSTLLLKVFCSIFTSPTSADGIDDSDNPESADGPPQKRKKTGKKKATKKNVASLLNMDGRVSGRSIAYAAVLLVFNLTEASFWVEVHNNFNFAAFYNFLVDYFEEFRNDASKKRVKDLLEWWNQQIFPQHVLTVAVSSESQDLLTAQQDEDYD